MKNRSLAVCLFIILLSTVFAGCSGNVPAVSSDTSTAGSTNMANPFIDCKSLEEAGEYAGFDFNVPVLKGDIYGAKEYPDSWVQAIEGELIQVYFLWDDEQVLFRKGRGEADISGDYNEYPVIDRITMENEENGSTYEVTLKGEDELYKLATWNYGGYAYSIWSTVSFDADWFMGNINVIMTNEAGGSV